ncbi:hypothetical protein [Natranaerobius trueperi]|uniref:Uncharacterized protein n=1 Tax=Natranaerobius trueperi TaxID=759412 RepID=A0A226C0Z5_9FIRM|nr:hypothetical protein [Natranaerobius trueperi]OWZ84040.1 hypothetical protein CDO51_05635 [Natranaerobius trueperi]
MKNDKAFIFKLGSEGRVGFSPPYCDVPEESESIDDLIPKKLQRKKDPLLPQALEREVMRDFLELATKTSSRDTGFYSLVTCTMKHNPIDDLKKKDRVNNASHTTSVGRLDEVTAVLGNQYQGGCLA